MLWQTGGPNPTIQMLVALARTATGAEVDLPRQRSGKRAHPIGARFHPPSPWRTPPRSMPSRDPEVTVIARRDTLVLTLGESGGLFDPVGESGIGLGGLFRLRVSGAESNFSIALCRLGISARWVSRLGTDPLGDLVVRTLHDEGVDLSFVVRDPTAPTAMTCKFGGHESAGLTYFRAGSAASRMQPGDVPGQALDGTSLVHVTGITLALGEGPQALVCSLAERAHKREIPVTFDLNYRAALWNARDAAEGCRAMLPYADWVLCGEDEARLLFGGDSPRSVIDNLKAAGASHVVLRIGAGGALIESDDRLVRLPAFPIGSIVDEVGAGDAFDAGFVYGILAGRGPAQSARIGNLLASRALIGTGHWETLPTIEEITSALFDHVAGDEIGT